MKMIRTNDKLANILENEVPKGQSYANWIVEQVERLVSHKQNAICWVVSILNLSTNRMSIGDENGSSPIFDEVIEIVDECPRTNMSNEKKENGWLGQTNDYSSYSHGGFASVESARTYITKFMEGRLIDEELIKAQYGAYGKYDENTEIYTTEKYDRFYFIAEWLENEDLKEITENLTDEQIHQLAEKEIKKAEGDSVMLLGDVEAYLIEMRDSFR